jgi:hypothetical protein
MEGQDEVFKSAKPVKVIIVGVEPGAGLFTKTYYSKPYGGADSSGEPPDCSSADGVRPDPWIQQPVNPDCKSCPKNQFGSALSRRGKPAKACHDSKRLYIARDDEKVQEEPINERKLYLSQIPVTSLGALAAYGRVMGDMGIEPWMAKTELSMDEDSEFPELKFSTIGYCSETELPLLKARAEKKEWAVSRNLMIQGQQARTAALPAHLQNALGMGSPTSAAAPAAGAAPQQPANPTVVDPNVVAAAQTVLETSAGQAPSNGDILKGW